jgi:uncharacterized protein (DUF488 family)
MISSDGNTRFLLTIGHSDRELPALVAALRMHGVLAVADVRSQPYSRLHPQFNREILEQGLKNAGVGYVFMGVELGARRAEREAYRDGQAKYELIRMLPKFKAGIERVVSGIATQRIALLCAEKDPITCHRMVLVGRELRNAAAVAHIREDDTLETNEAAQTRLIDEVGLPQHHLFMDRAALIEQAYDLQAEKIAFRETEPVAASESWA